MASAVSLVNVHINCVEHPVYEGFPRQEIEKHSGDVSFILLSDVPETFCLFGTWQAFRLVRVKEGCPLTSDWRRILLPTNPPSRFLSRGRIKVRLRFSITHPMRDTYRWVLEPTNTSLHRIFVLSRRDFSLSNLGKMSAGAWLSHWIIYLRLLISRTPFGWPRDLAPRPSTAPSIWEQERY